MVHRPVDSGWTETCVTDDRVSGATTTANVPGARPARGDVPQGVDVPSHPHRVGRTVASCESCHHSHRIGEVTNSCARWTLVASLLQGRGSSEDGLLGCPTRRAMEVQTVRGLLHPQDLGQYRVAIEAAELTQRWTEPLAVNPLRKAAHLSRDSLSVTIYLFYVSCFSGCLESCSTNKFVTGEGEGSVRD